MASKEQLAEWVEVVEAVLRLTNDVMAGFVALRELTELDIEIHWVWTRALSRVYAPLEVERRQDRERRVQTYGHGLSLLVDQEGERLWLATRPQSP